MPDQTAPQLGVQLYSVRNDLGPQLDHTLARLAEIGFTHIEPYDILSDTIGLERAMTAAGLTALSAHAKITELDRTAVLDAAATLGIGTVLVPWVDPAVFDSKDGVLRLAEEINEAAVAGEAHGIRVGYHNHEFEFASRLDGAAAWELLVANLEPRVVLELDTFWASVGGADVFEIIERLRERVKFLHLTNELPDEEDLPIRGVDITERKGEVLRFGRGSVELDVLEIVVDGDVFPSLQRNFDYFSLAAAS